MVGWLYIRVETGCITVSWMAGELGRQKKRKRDIQCKHPKQNYLVGTSKSYQWEDSEDHGIWFGILSRDMKGLELRILIRWVRSLSCLGQHYGECGSSNVIKLHLWMSNRTPWNEHDFHSPWLMPVTEMLIWSKKVTHFESNTYWSVQFYCSLLGEIMSSIYRIVVLPRQLGW